MDCTAGHVLQVLPRDASAVRGFFGLAKVSGVFLVGRSCNFVDTPGPGQTIKSCEVEDKRIDGPVDGMYPIRSGGAGSGSP